MFDSDTTIRSDLRISCNTETPAQFDPNLKVKSERVKERTTFTFQWMRLDFTVARLQLPG